MIAGGVESMSRAPFVMAKSEAAFARAVRVEDSTLGWRFINPRMQARYGTDSMPETAENVAEEFRIARGGNWHETSELEEYMTIDNLRSRSARLFNIGMRCAFAL